METPDSNISDKNSCENNTDNQHEFALFFENLSENLQPIFPEQELCTRQTKSNNNQDANLTNNTQKTDFASSISCKNSEIVIQDHDIIHRVLNVLRLEVGDNLVIFDKNINANFKLLDFNKKKNLKLRVIKAEKNKIIEPKINFLLPMLKRENLELSIYACQELGVNEITMLKTEKSQNVFNAQRAAKILVSAAEQSKNFNISNINLPIELKQYINFSSEDDSIKIFFDSEGEKLNDVIAFTKNKLSENINLKINLMIGPEADLTDKEKALIKENKFIFCKLTPTILRACQATNVAIGAFRALLD